MSLFEVEGVEGEEDAEDGDECRLCIWWKRAGRGGLELGGARLWSGVGPLTTLAPRLAVEVMVCASVVDGMLRDVLLEGVESAWLEGVPVDDPDGESDGDDDEDEEVVGIHDDNAGGTGQCSRWVVRVISSWCN